MCGVLLLSYLLRSVQLLSFTFTFLLEFRLRSEISRINRLISISRALALHLIEFFSWLLFHWKPKQDSVLPSALVWQHLTLNRLLTFKLRPFFFPVVDNPFSWKLFQRWSAVSCSMSSIRTLNWRPSYRPHGDDLEKKQIYRSSINLYPAPRTMLMKRRSIDFNTTLIGSERLKNID